MAVINDTTTTLNSGSGGDVMDESLVTQSDGVTAAKRPRVVPGGDDGSIQTFNNNGTQVEAHVQDQKAEITLSLLLMEARRQTALLRLILAASGHPGVSLKNLDELGSEGATI